MKHFFLTIAIVALPLLNANATESVTQRYPVQAFDQETAEHQAKKECKADLRSYQECRLSDHLSGEIFGTDFYGNSIVLGYKAVFERIQLDVPAPSYNHNSRYKSNSGYGSSHFNSGYGY